MAQIDPCPEDRQTQSYQTKTRAWTVINRPVAMVWLTLKLPTVKLDLPFLSPEINLLNDLMGQVTYGRISRHNPS